MSRLYAIVAIAEDSAGQVVSAISGASIERPGIDRQDICTPHLRVEYGGLSVDVIAILHRGGVSLPVTSAAPSGLWDLWALVADSRDVPDGHWRWVAAFVRRLRQRAAAAPAWCWGPYSRDEIAERWPELADEHLKDEVLDAEGNPRLVWSLPTLAGDPQEAWAADYRPSQQEIDGDVDPDPATLFGGEP